MVSVDMITYRYMALHVQTTMTLMNMYLCVNHSFLFILGEDIDGSDELDLKKPKLSIQRNSIFYPHPIKNYIPFPI